MKYAGYGSVPAHVAHTPRGLRELLPEAARRHPRRDALIFAVAAAGHGR